MAYITLGNLNQLQLEIPTEGTKDWGNRLRDNFIIKLVEHDHSGNGKGAPLGISSFADNIINDVKIRLTNDNYLRSRNSGNTADVNLIKANSSNNIVIGDSTALQSTIINSVTTTVNALNVNGALNIPAASIGTNEVENDSITQDKMAINSVGTNELIDNSIPQSKMQDNSVGTAKLINSNVTAEKLATNAALNNIGSETITNDKMANNSIDDTKIRLRNDQWLKGRNAADNADVNIVKVNSSNVIEFAGTVTATPAVGSVGTTELADDGVTNAKLANMAANTAKVNATASSAGPSDIAIPVNTVLGRKAGNIVAEKVVGDQIAINTVTLEKLNFDVSNRFDPFTVIINTNDGSQDQTILNGTTVILSSGAGTGTVLTFDFASGKARVINDHSASLSVTIRNDGPSSSATLTITANSYRDIYFFFNGGYKLRATASIAMAAITI